MKKININKFNLNLSDQINIKHPGLTDIKDKIILSGNKSKISNFHYTRNILLKNNIFDNNTILYDPLLSVEFINRFDSSLGLTESDINKKHLLMKESPLKYFTMNPSLFINDIKNQYSECSKLLKRESPQMVINGDLHLNNFGTMYNKNKKVVWGINDFDQAGSGKPEWDIERLSVSFILAAQELGFKKEKRIKLVEKIADAYFENILKEYTQNDPYLTKKHSDVPVKELIEKDEENDQMSLLKKFTVKDHNNNYVFKSNHDLVSVDGQTKNKIQKSINNYFNQTIPFSDSVRPDKILDISEKIDSGGSSYGLKRYWILSGFSDPSRSPVILDLKEILPSPLNNNDQDKYFTQRQKILGGYLNFLTDTLIMDNKTFLIREREDVKSRIDLNNIRKSEDLINLAVQSSKITARSHSYTIEQNKMLKNWLLDDKKQFSDNLIKFSFNYTEQIKKNFKAFI